MIICLWQNEGRFSLGENLNYSKKASSEQMRLFIVIITKIGHIALYISLNYVRNY